MSVVGKIDWFRVVDRCGTLDRNRSNDIVGDSRSRDSNRCGIVDGCLESSAIRRGTCSRDLVVVVCSVVDSTIDCGSVLVVVQSTVVGTIVSDMFDLTCVVAIDAIMSR